ncbi:SLAIN motif-containing protein-like [Polymixia lowei]
MELQDQPLSEKSRNISNQLPGLNTNAYNHLFAGELKSNSEGLKGSSDSYCSTWLDLEQTRINNEDGLSSFVETSKRRDNFHFGPCSHLPCCDLGGTYEPNCQTDQRDKEPIEEQSALDSVELLDLEDDVQDEESWLYESPRKQVIAEKSTEPALKWCRQVLDNPSPEMEAACRVLINTLDQRSRGFLSNHAYRRPLVFRELGCACVESRRDQRSTDTTQDASDSLDDRGMNVSQESITTDYRLQDLTDVHIMARIQQDSLRQDYESSPTTTSLDSPNSFALPTSCKDTDQEFDVYERTGSGSSSLSSSSACQSPTSFAKQSCHSPQLAKFHHQVTQFKLLKLAQKNRAAASRSSLPSPTPALQTSLRSLQAVRNSRSVKNNTQQTTEPISRLTSPTTARPLSESSCSLAVP